MIHCRILVCYHGNAEGKGRDWTWRAWMFGDVTDTHRSIIILSVVIFKQFLIDFSCASVRGKCDVRFAKSACQKKTKEDDMPFGQSRKWTRWEIKRKDVQQKGCCWPCDVDWTHERGKTSIWQSSKKSSTNSNYSEWNCPWLFSIASENNDRKLKDGARFLTKMRITKVITFTTNVSVQFNGNPSHFHSHGHISPKATNVKLLVAPEGKSAGHRSRDDAVSLEMMSVCTKFCGISSSRGWGTSFKVMYWLSDEPPSSQEGVAIKLLEICNSLAC